MTCFEQINDCDTEMAKREEEKEGVATCCSFSNSLAIQTARSVAIDYARFIHENVALLSRFEFDILCSDINGEMIQSDWEKII